MSLNKLMHPRNIYKTPPSFKQMAIDYPEFRKYVKQDISGKIRIDFKDNETLKCLTQTLLKKDFDLNVFIPLNRLIPTVPLRLNYILWLEDLLSLTQNTETVHGIDIGTGASCIYPLLCSKKNNWKMLATEIDEESFGHAQKNVSNNKLEHLIKVIKSKEQILTDIVEENVFYDFCMCNPPFFSSVDELDPFQKARTENRSLPRNAQTGTETETVSQGGEVEFIGNIIRESTQLRTRIKIYSSMIGQKSSLAKLKVILRNTEVHSFKHTEFHQGHTTRWGLAWTFHQLDLTKIPQSVKTVKKKRTLTHELPVKYSNFHFISHKFEELFQILHFTYDKIKSTATVIIYEVIVSENTWSNQRRKRREAKRNKDIVEAIQDISFVSTSSKSDDLNMSTDCENDKKRQRESESTDEESTKRQKVDAKNVLLGFTLVVCKQNDKFILTLEQCMNYPTNSDYIHQIFQYFKNNL